MDMTLLKRGIWEKVESPVGRWHIATHFLIPEIYQSRTCPIRNQFDEYISLYSHWWNLSVSYRTNCVTSFKWNEIFLCRHGNLIEKLANFKSNPFFSDLKGTFLSLPYYLFSNMKTDKSNWIRTFLFMNWPIHLMSWAVYSKWNYCRDVSGMKSLRIDKTKGAIYRSGSSYIFPQVTEGIKKRNWRANFSH